MSNARILIAEDEQITAQHIRKRLERLGYEVVATVDTGEEAIQRAVELEPCLAIMDIKLAGNIDGIEAAARIREHTGVPAIYLTAFADDQTLERAKRTEPLGYILKPFGPEQLRTAIEMALSRKRIETRLRTSQARYRAVSELSSDFAYSLEVADDGAVRCEWITDAFHRITGYDLGHLKEAGDWREIVCAEDRNVYDQRLENLLNGMPDARVYRIRTAPGDVRWIRDSARAEWDRDQRRVQRIIGAAQDITAQKEIEDELRHERSLYGALFENIPIQTVVVDRRGRIIAYNKAKETSGDRLPPMGATMYRDYAARHHADMHAELMRAMAENKRREFPDAPYGDRRLNIAITPFEEGAIITTQDITDIKRAEKERRIYEGRLRHAEKLESLGVMAGGIAHDFNNLLMAVLGNTELALMDLPPESPLRKSLKAIDQAARKAADLSTQMLAYSGKGRLQFRNTDADEVAREAVDAMRPQLGDNIRLNLNCDGNLPEVAADAGQLVQVVRDLIANSIEAIGAHEGAISMRTCSRTRKDDRARWLETVTELSPGRYVEIAVQDTGGGIDPAHIDRVFDPFFTTRFTGRGLGLSAALGIVRAHGGSIGIENHPGTGLLIRILLPCEEPQILRPDDPAPAPRQGDTRTVLVVDDEESVRQVSCDMLRRLGYESLCASDGVEALETLNTAHAGVDCILLDLTMPRMGGVATFQRIRQVAPHVPVVLSSGYSVEEATRRFNDEDLAGFIQKPYQSEALAETLNRALRKPEIPPIKQACK